MATVLIERPWLAVIAAALLAGLWFVARSRVVLIATLLWAAYGVWEYAVGHDGPDADIRVDLLVIYPVLLGLTLAALWRGLTYWRRGSR